MKFCLTHGNTVCRVLLVAVFNELFDNVSFLFDSPENSFVELLLKKLNLFKSVAKLLSIESTNFCNRLALLDSVICSIHLLNLHLERRFVSSLIVVFLTDYGNACTFKKVLVPTNASFLPHHLFGSNLRNAWFSFRETNYSETDAYRPNKFLLSPTVQTEMPFWNSESHDFFTSHIENF